MSPLLAQESDEQSQAEAKEKDKLPEEIASLRGTARSAPPEYTTDILFRVARSPKVPDPIKEELLHEAFTLARLVQHPLCLGGTSHTTDTRSFNLEMAMDVALDSLSIQCRAIRALLPLDRERAVELFRSLPEPEVPVGRCEDRNVIDLTRYYQTLTDVANKGFSAEEVEEEEHVKLVLAQLRSISSSLQLAPVAKTLTDIEVTPKQLELLIDAYSERLTSVSDSDREFSFAVGRLRFANPLKELVAKVRSQKVPLLSLLSGLRDYLVRHLTGVRCEDTVAEKSFMAKAVVGLVSLYNTELRFVTDAAEEGLPPIEGEDTVPSEVKGRPEFEEFFTTQKAKHMLLGAQRLRYGAGQDYVSIETRLSPEWQRTVFDYMTELESWEPRYEESKIVFFHRKAGLYGALLDLTPKSAFKQRVLSSYGSYLGRSPVQSSHPIEFLWQLNLLLDQARSMSDEARSGLEQFQAKGGRVPNLPGDSKEEILRELTNSRSVVLALYGSAERLLPAEHRSWMLWSPL